MVDDKNGRPEEGEKGEKADAEKARAHQSGSFLVRFWVERSDVPGEEVLRGCIKNLQTGKEQYVSDPGKIGDLVRGHLKDKEKSRERALEASEKDTESDGDQTWVGNH